MADSLFDPEGSGYDYDTALLRGIRPKDGHWPSRDIETGLLLKGRKHETWDLLEKGEKEAGYKIFKKDGRYYSQPKSSFQKLDEKVEESRFAKFDRTMALTREIFKQIRSNALGQPSGEWVNPQRQPGSVQPGIYGTPRNEMVDAQVSGYWKKPLATYMEFVAKNPGASTSKIMRGTGLDKYHIKTLKKLMADNATLQNFPKTIKLETWRGSEIPIKKNMTPAQQKELVDRFNEFYPNAPKGEVKIRSTIDTEGNRYSWMSGDATHDMVEFVLKKKFGLFANQNNPYDWRVVSGIK